MDLTIRSQDKTSLVKINNGIGLKYDDNKTIIANYIPDFTDNYDGFYDILGTYKSRERALEILDDIHNCIQINATFNLYSRLGNFANNFNEKHYFIPVYQMPKE